MRISDWSSDVCSSDLSGYAAYAPPSQRRVWGRWAEQDINGQIAQASHPHPQAVFGVPGDSEHDGVDVVIADERLQIHPTARSEEHTSELQSLMRISYAVFCLKKKKQENKNRPT